MVMFEDCRVPQRNLVSQEGNGFKIAMRALDGGRINIGRSSTLEALLHILASCSLGGAAFALDQAKDYTQSRKQFGKSLSDFQYLQFKMADLATDLVSSRLMVRNAAQFMDEDVQRSSITRVLNMYTRTQGRRCTPPWPRDTRLINAST